MTFTASKLLVLVALILFILAAVGIGALGPLATVPLGLAVLAGSFLVP